MLGQCEEADALLAAHQLESARSAYASALSGTPRLQCALSGFDAVAQAHLERAEAFLQAGLVDSASQNFVRVVSQRPASEAAWEAQRQLLGLAGREERTRQALVRDSVSRAGLATTRAFAELGLHAEAREALEEAIEADPTLLVPPDLQYLSGGPWGGWRGFRRWVERWIRFAPGSAVLLLVGGWLGTTVLRKPRLTIDDFDTASLDKAPKIGEGFGVMIGTRLLDLVRGEEAQALQWVSGPVGEVSVPAEVQGLVPGGGAWMEATLRLIRSVEPRRSLSLSGHLHENESKGLGVTLQLRRGRRFVAGATLWLADFLSDAGKLDRQQAYPALAEVGSIWLLYQLRRHNRDFSVLGARDWRAFALARLAAHQRSDAVRSALLVRALRRDAGYWGALANLGGTFFSRAAKVRLTNAAEAAEDLELAKGFLESALRMSSGSTAARDDPTPYAARYTLSLVYDALGDSDEAKDRARKLLERIDVVTSERSGSALASYLTRMRPTVELMLAIHVGREEVERITERDEFHGATDTQYALAAAWSRLAKADSPGSPARTAAEERALLHLGRCLAIGDERLKRWARRDWSMDWIRTASNTKDRFEKLVGPEKAAAPPPAVAPPLSELMVIPAELAEKLSEVGIPDWEALLQATATADRREGLAGSLGVPEPLVETWANLADLQRIVGLRTADANLLYLGGVRTMRALASTPSDVVLADTLSKLAGSQRIQPPAQETVTAWIYEAGKLPSKVV